MKIIERKDETNQQVTADDQRNINRFSNLASRISDHQEQVAFFKKQKEDFKDLLDEMELMDEEEDTIKIRKGDAFVYETVQGAREATEQEIEKVDVKIEDEESKVEAIEKEMAELKRILYEKFGKAINLERE